MYVAPPAASFAPSFSKRWAAVGLGLALGLAGCRATPSAKLQVATDLMYAKDYVGAQKVLRLALKSFEAQRPADSATTAGLCTALDRLGRVNALYLRDYPQALADLGLLSRRCPQSEAARSGLLLMADIYQYRQAKPAEAIAAYAQVVQRFADSREAPVAQLAIVQAYVKLKEYARARTEAAHITRTWATSAEATQAAFEIADTYYRERQFTEAIRTYEALLADKPAPKLATLVRFEMGNCYQELDAPQRALDAYYSALADHPNPGLVQRKIARVRSRIYNLAPSEGILNTPPPSRRMLALQHRRLAKTRSKP